VTATEDRLTFFGPPLEVLPRVIANVPRYFAYSTQHNMNDDIRIRVLAAADAAAFWQLGLEALQTEPHAYGASVEEDRTISVE
jgi:hypothetical protein